MVRYQMINGKKMRIGLTGGIGAGKSTAAAYLRRLNVYVLDADDASRRVVRPGQPGLGALVGRYGRGILQPSGELNRQALADIIFRSAEERKAVDDLLHPIIRRWMEWAEGEYHKKFPDVPVVWDVPLLIETGMHTGMDEVWLVVADDELRIARIMQRDDCAREQAEARIQSQMPQWEKIKYADVVIYNNTTVEEFYVQVQACFERVF